MFRFHHSLFFWSSIVSFSIFLPILPKNQRRHKLCFVAIDEMDCLAAHEGQTRDGTFDQISMWYQDGLKLMDINLSSSVLFFFLFPCKNSPDFFEKYAFAFYKNWSDKVSWIQFYTWKRYKNTEAILIYFVGKR